MRYEYYELPRLIFFRYQRRGANHAADVQRVAQTYLAARKSRDAGGGEWLHSPLTETGSRSDAHRHYYSAQNRCGFEFKATPEQLTMCNYSLLIAEGSLIQYDH